MIYYLTVKVSYSILNLDNQIPKHIFTQSGETNCSPPIVITNQEGAVSLAIDNAAEYIWAKKEL